MILNGFNFKLLLFLSFIHCFSILGSCIYVSYAININLFILFLFFLPSIVFTNTTWALIHEGIHSNLNSSSKKNLLYSRILSVLLHSNFELLKFGHLIHHRYNRSKYDLTEGYDSKSSKLISNIFYYFYISTGLYIAEVFGPLFLLLPIRLVLYIAESFAGKNHEFIINAKKNLLQPNKIKNMRIDSVINIIFMIVICISFGKYLAMYFLFFALRGLLISSSDNLPHYGASLDKVNGSFNLQAPSLWQKMILNFNYHRTHHRYPNTPWHLLPTKFIEDKDSFDIKYFKQYFRQWQGVIAKDKLIADNKI